MKLSLAAPEVRCPLTGAAARYVMLLKRSVLGELDPEKQLRLAYLRWCAEGNARFERGRLHDVRAHDDPRFAEVLGAMREGRPPDWDIDQLGFALTMSGRQRIENVESCVYDLIERRIPGDFIECGVWRGGVVIFMRGLLEALGVGDRVVWAADSFAGQPPPLASPDLDMGEDLTKNVTRSLAVDLATVKRNLSAHELLDDQVAFLEGWFRLTLPKAPIDRLALLRVDGNMYTSTDHALDALYDRVSEGGYVIVGDYGLPNSRRAVDDFRSRRGIFEPLFAIDWSGALWRKGG